MRKPCRQTPNLGPAILDNLQHETLAGARPTCLRPLHDSKMDEETPFLLDEQQPPESSSSPRAADTFGRRRSSGPLADAEVPLLEGEHSAGRTPPSPKWPALRLSSVTTRKLHVGSWGADGQGEVCWEGRLVRRAPHMWHAFSTARSPCLATGPCAASTKACQAAAQLCTTVRCARREVRRCRAATTRAPSSPRGLCASKVRGLSSSQHRGASSTGTWLSCILLWREYRCARACEAEARPLRLPPHRERPPGQPPFPIPGGRRPP